MRTYSFPRSLSTKQQQNKLLKEHHLRSSFNAYREELLAVHIQIQICGSMNDQFGELKNTRTNTTTTNKNTFYLCFSDPLHRLKWSVKKKSKMSFGYTGVYLGFWMMCHKECCSSIQFWKFQQQLWQKQLMHSIFKTAMFKSKMIKLRVGVVGPDWKSMRKRRRKSRKSDVKLGKEGVGWQGK